MLSFHANKGVQFCDGLTRRDFLRAGALSAGAVGLNLADLTRLQAAEAGKSKDINCILLFLVGGPSHVDTWDLKPNAPDNVRGPFRPIKTNVPGMEICEHFPLMAKRADLFSIVRSVYHKQSAVHGSGHQMMQTGYFFQGGKEHPHYGAVVSYLRGRDAGGLPPFVILPGPVGSIGDNLAVRAQSSGPLGAKHEPFYLRGDAAEKGFKITDLQAPPGLDPARLKKRKDLLDAVDSAHRAFDATETIRARDSAYEGAFDLLFAEKAKKAFDIGSEDERLRARYGRNTFGQSCLLARRLVQSGVRLVTVNMFDTVFSEICWDCHADGGSLNTNLTDYKETLCPMFDMAYTALLDDLKQRGMLDNTLVVAMGEFGRTPQLNARGGRDHWPGCWSVLFAGGRIKGGKVVGASDKIGAEPRDRPVSPDIVAATVYEAMGIDLNTTRITGSDDRPTPIIEADPIEELLR
jgi:hypothetical protein